MPALRHQILDNPTAPVPCGDLLDNLRTVAMLYRSSPRMDLFEACKLIDPDPHVALRAYSTALVRTLSQALGKRPGFRAPGSEPGFDEVWLMRLIDRAVIKDQDSVAFLIRSRVKPYGRTAFMHLINGLAQQLLAD